MFHDVPTSPRTLTDETAQRLRQDIIHGITPAGTRLAEAAVAKQLGVSRVPVREALVMLEREGLIGFSTTGRAYVKDLTPQDFEELFLLRLALEPLSARFAAAQLKGDASLLEQNIRETSHAKTLRDVTSLDLDFHQIILEASLQPRLVRLWKSLRPELELWLSRLHRNHQTQTHATRQTTVEAHTRMLECFRGETPAAAEKITRQHIVGWREWLPSPGELPSA
ncbi:GntR family transcriptional regulator [Roseimicrobium gellanilyticum]|uniref:GntR family transcriptional regulator n=1 Tax=Roseimicrobium gellanilyticum TaxID=748857 RepID=A0A366HIG3_9BACT|nr:GntR family transcriptional regulator [Roseimicrobium gellanilyticum]RBP42557.1 GntR family transcriptional regulator [Roseimicrobium gellanilyticum]